MRIIFECKTNDPLDVVRLRNAKPPDGITITLPPSPAIKIFPIEQIAEFALQVDIQIAATLIAGWLLNELKDSNSKTITIEKYEVSLNEGEITRIIKEITRIDKK